MNQQLTVSGLYLLAAVFLHSGTFTLRVNERKLGPVFDGGTAIAVLLLAFSLYLAAIHVLLS